MVAINVADNKKMPLPPSPMCCTTPPAKCKIALHDSVSNKKSYEKLAQQHQQQRPVVVVVREKHSPFA